MSHPTRHDGEAPRSALLRGVVILDRTQSVQECEDLCEDLETHLALVDPDDPAYWTPLGVWESARHDRGGRN